MLVETDVLKKGKENKKKQMFRMLHSHRKWILVFVSSLITEYIFCFFHFVSPSFRFLPSRPSSLRPRSRPPLSSSSSSSQIAAVLLRAPVCHKRSLALSSYR